MSHITGTSLEPVPPSPIPRRKAWYRRPVLIVPLVLVVAAAVAITLVLVLIPRGITVRGKVIDKLTGQPVAAAHLRTDGMSATTGTDGAFRMEGVATDATLRVSARYYASAQAKAATAPMTVQLTPIPVHISVTSALTGRPLAGSLTTPAGPAVALAADGTATLYRIGPGEKVTVTAAGYRPASAVIGSGNAATVKLAPTAATVSSQLLAWDRARDYQAIIDWVLGPATGYTFMGTSQQEWAQRNKEPTLPQIAYTGGGFIVPSGASNVADVSATVWIGWPGDRWDTPGMASMIIGSGAHPVTLAGERAWHGGPDSNHLYSTVWSSGPVFAVLAGPDQAKLDATMAGIIKAMHGEGKVS